MIKELTGPPPMIRASVDKKRTNDGMVELCEHVPLGKIITVDAAFCIDATMYNSARDCWHNKLVCYDVEIGQLFTCELLGLSKEHFRFYYDMRCDVNNPRTWATMQESARLARAMWLKEKASEN